MLALTAGAILCDKHSIQRILGSKGHPITVAVDLDWEKYYTARYDDALSEAESLVLTPTGAIVEIGASSPTRDKVQGQYIGLVKLQGAGASIFLTHYKR